MFAAQAGASGWASVRAQDPALSAVKPPWKEIPVSLHQLHSQIKPYLNTCI